jgi:hypothetical protein
MAKPFLNSSQVNASIRKGIAAGVPQAMRMKVR